MIWILLIVVCGLALILGAILVAFREREKDSFSEIQIDLRPTVRITSFDGWVALELQLVNRSYATVWIEEAKLVITDLEANFQTARATSQQIHKIRQTVVPDECLSMSIAGSLYEAAGRPQGRYSFVLRGTVHYRSGEDFAQANIRPHRVEMTALSVVRVRRIRQKSAAVGAHDEQKITSGSLTQVALPKKR
jgi:hypothetical protein